MIDLLGVHGPEAKLSRPALVDPIWGPRTGRGDRCIGVHPNDRIGPESTSQPMSRPRKTSTLRSGSPLDQRVGISIESRILAQLDPAKHHDFLERPVSEERAALERQKQAMSEALAARDRLLPTLDENELASYFERKKLYGEVAAVQWLQSKHR